MGSFTDTRLCHMSGSNTPLPGLFHSSELRPFRKMKEYASLITAIPCSITHAVFGTTRKTSRIRVGSDARSFRPNEVRETSDSTIAAGTCVSLLARKWWKDGELPTSAENVSLQLTCSNLDCYPVRFGIAFDLWMLNFLDARRAKAHFESRPRSRCRPDSPSSSLCASTADSDGVRNVQRRDQWLARRLEPLIEGSQLAPVPAGSPSPTPLAQLCVLPARLVSSGLFMPLFRLLEYVSVSFGIPPHRCESQ